MADFPRVDVASAPLRVPYEPQAPAEGITRLAGEIAHDFNNLLSAILGNLALARAAPANLPAALLAAEHAALRAADLARRLATLARRRSAESRSRDLPGGGIQEASGEGLGSAAQAPPWPDPHGPCVLFIDDHEVVRRIGADLLRTMGLRVCSCASVQEAEGALDEGRAFDLLLLDGTLQGESSGTVAARFRGLRPDLPIVVAAPCSPGIGRRLARNLGAEGFVSKPFRREELRAVVSETLAANEPVQPAAVITS